MVDLSLGEEACVLEVKRACETYGFFYLTGVDKVVTGDLCVNSVFEGAGRFFQLPQEKKDTFKAKRIDEHPFGYQSAVLENIKLDPTGQKLPDQREQLKFGRGTYLLDYHAFMNRKTVRPLFQFFLPSNVRFRFLPIIIIIFFFRSRKLIFLLFFFSLFSRNNTRSIVPAAAALRVRMLLLVHSRRVRTTTRVSFGCRRRAPRRLGDLK